MAISWLSSDPKVPREIDISNQLPFFFYPNFIKKMSNIDVLNSKFSSSTSENLESV